MIDTCDHIHFPKEALHLLTPHEIKAYLERFGMPEVEEPSLDYLMRLHRAHVERFSWQTVDIVAGRPASIDPKQSVQLLLTGRSGYCFHLNGAFGTLLRSLGYQVDWHRAGVQPNGESPRVNGFHLAQTVTIGAGEDGQERWIVDVGLGDMPYEPLPLVHGSYVQGAYTYGVTSSAVAPGGWRLEHDALASFVGVDVAPEIVDDITPFLSKHEHYSTSPESPWMNTFLLRHRHATGGNELRGCIWSSREGKSIRKTELLDKQQWLDVMGDVFGEKLVVYDGLERDALWSKVLRLHEDWKRAKEAADKAAP
ncbi:arylamine N-acetyltransferase family protein [Paenibacillus soyae]|uniref:Arylamine N-acetyltransferase n=1 Tax=Paenibacillus soyae TaxID=2969249 RepID=A0A9X2MT91_9BACL|nr:arylamine N-acetyltransferase [Paenibacillus soyae]MCR2806040.1 arylamine N-acetyltransferase [Paenibacillus soyae]